MAASAIFGGGPASRLSRRPPGRLSIVAWAIAATAVMAAAASVFVDAGPAAFALVARMPDPIEAGHPADAAIADVAPAEALIDPRDFRKPPPPADGRPRVAILVAGLGISAVSTTAAIEKLPAEISLSFSPYGRTLQKQADDARAAGHEVFVDIPLEPQGFPGNDAGPQAILSSLPATENVERLRWSLARFTGFAGVVLAGGSPALNSPETVAPLLQGASVDGLVWAHAPTRGFEGSAAETVEIAFAIDGTPDAHDIDVALERLEATARKKGSALGLAGSYPVTLERIAAWSAALEARGIVLVPASAVARVKRAPRTADATPAHAPADTTPAHASADAPPPVSEAHGEHH
jgi:polysaccharide deacetylase 2 family uncharacterized protein YibQ